MSEEYIFIILFLMENRENDSLNKGVVGNFKGVYLVCASVYCLIEKIEKQICDI